MKFTELQNKLLRNKSYRSAYNRLGDCVITAIHFGSARKAAGITRSQLAAQLGLTTSDVTKIEDDFNFSDTRSVSLIADRLGGHLQPLGVDPEVFYVEGGRIADLPPKPEKPARPINWKLSDFTESRRENFSLPLSGRLKEEDVTPEQIQILNRVASGETSKREGVRELINRGVVQIRAEQLIALLGKK